MLAERRLARRIRYKSPTGCTSTTRRIHKYSESVQVLLKLQEYRDERSRHVHAGQRERCDGLPQAEVGALVKVVTPSYKIADGYEIKQQEAKPNGG